MTTMEESLGSRLEHVERRRRRTKIVRGTAVATLGLLSIWMILGAIVAHQDRTVEQLMNDRSAVERG